MLKLRNVDFSSSQLFSAMAEAWFALPELIINDVVTDHLVVQVEQSVGCVCLCGR